MNDRQANALAEILQEKGKVYIREVDGEYYVSVHVYSRNLMLIDRLLRVCGTLYVMRRGTRDWTWARRHEFRKYLPIIVSRMPAGKQRDLLQLVYRWSCVTGTHRAALIRELAARKSVLQGRAEDESDPDSSDPVVGNL